jgi:polar amino acid transport system substrate-binding protein
VIKMRSVAALAIAGTVVLASCGSDKKSESTTTTAAATTTAASGGTAAPGGTVDCKPIKAGVLTVVTSLPGPNFWGSGEEDPDKIKSGIEYDLANDIAAKCGLKMESRNEGFDAIVAGQIAPDSYDIALSQVTITEDRAKVVDFSVGYFKSDQGFLCPKGTKASTWDDVKKLKLAVQASTTAEYYFSSDGPKQFQIPGVKSYPDLASAYAALNAGQIDCVVIDTPINLGQASQSGGKLEVVGQFATGEEYGAIYGKGNGKKAILDPIIQGLLDDGTVTALISKYLGGDPTTVPFIDVPAA